MPPQGCPPNEAGEALSVMLTQPCPSMPAAPNPQHSPSSIEQHPDTGLSLAWCRYDVCAESFRTSKAISFCTTGHKYLWLGEARQEGRCRTHTGYSTALITQPQHEYVFHLAFASPQTGPPDKRAVAHGPITVQQSQSYHFAGGDTALLQWGEDSNEVAHLSERQAVFGPPAFPAIIQLWNGAWWGIGEGLSGHRGGDPGKGISLLLLCPLAAHWLCLQLLYRPMIGLACDTHC